MTQKLHQPKRVSGKNENISVLHSNNNRGTDQNFSVGQISCSNNPYLTFPHCLTLLTIQPQRGFPDDGKMMSPGQRGSWGERLREDSDPEFDAMDDSSEHLRRQSWVMPDSTQQQLQQRQAHERGTSNAKGVMPSGPGGGASCHGHPKYELKKSSDSSVSSGLSNSSVAELATSLELSEWRVGGGIRGSADSGKMGALPLLLPPASRVEPSQTEESTVHYSANANGTNRFARRRASHLRYVQSRRSNTKVMLLSSVLFPLYWLY